MTRNRKMYASRRMSLACDRVIIKQGDVAKAALWVRAWAKRAGIQRNESALKESA